VKKLILLSYSLIATASFCIAQRMTNDNFRTQEREAARSRRETNRLEMEQHKIVLTYQRDAQGNIDFTCENKAYCNYIVEVTFEDLRNLEADVSLPVRVTVTPGTQRIFTLKKITIGQPIHYNYHYKTFKGCTNPHADTAFAYLLPVAPGKETRSGQEYYLAQKFGGESEPRGWYALTFHVQSGDTVFAARSGRVTETLEEADIKDTGVSYARGENFVEIAHNDCSFGRYRVFRDSSIFVHAGDWVVAGQPIGIAGGDKYNSGPQVQFSVYYNYDEDVIKDGQPTGKVHHWAYVPMQFWTKDKGKIRLTNHASYISEHPADLITREMTKKEAKKWASNHKS
jgi:hypothetical protein